MISYQPKDGKCNADCAFYYGDTNECGLVGGVHVGVGLDCFPYLSDLAKGMPPQNESEGRAYMPKSKRQDYETPWWLFELLDAEFQFTVDAAAHSRNAKLERYWTEEIDGLQQDWTDETIYINPPFAVADLRRWTERAHNASREPGTKVVMLVPVKSDQDWWGDFAIRAEIRFIIGRVTFEGEKGTFPGPCAVLVFGKYVKAKNLLIRVPHKSKR